MTMTRLTGPGVVTIPLTVTDLLLDDADQRAAARAAAKPFGSSSEVPLTALDEIAPGLGEVAVEFFLAARALWASYDRGEKLGDAVIVRVPLLDLRQVDSKAARIDLVAQAQSLEDMPETRDAGSILDAKPRWSKLRTLGTLSRTKDRATLMFTVSSRRWPLELGGPGCPGELRREILLEVSHAAWRDRRSRRLVRFAACAVEVWPDPEPFRDRLD
jgi:hypothetical protein